MFHHVCSTFLCFLRSSPHTPQRTGDLYSLDNLLLPCLQGVLSIGWCPHDPSLLISTGRDGRALLWDVNSGEVLSELPTAGQGDVAFETKWSPLMPGVFSCSTTGSEIAGTEGKVSIWDICCLTWAGFAAAAH